MARHMHPGPDTWLGSWEGDVFTMHRESLRWLSPLRGSIVTTALALVGLQMGGAALGVPLAMGALFAAVLDVDQVAGRRARTMLWGTLWLTVAAALGSIASVSPALIMLLALPVTAVCGYVGAAGARAAIAGVVCLVTFSAFTFTPMSTAGMIQATAMVACGCLVQTAATVIATLVRDPGALRDADSPAPLRPRLAQHAALRDDFVRHAIRLTIAMEAAFVLDFFVPGIHSVWIPITVAWVATPDRHGTVTKAIGRIIGTLVGVTLVVTASWLTGYATATLIIGLALSAFLGLVTLRVNYSLAVVGITGFMLSLFALTGDTVDVLAVDRILDTLMAAAIVLLAINLILPGPSPQKPKVEAP